MKQLIAMMRKIPRDGLFTETESCLKSLCGCRSSIGNSVAAKGQEDCSF